ncbi:MAG TPA: hypothetical protein VL096_00225 [Pirellulaceae bacterium]|nr:hypothetical protein [Pirellulaceae bacterium]
MLAFSCAVAAILLSADPAVVATNQPVQRRFHELDKDISAAMKRESSARDLVERSAAVRQIIALYKEVDQDERTPLSPGMTEYRTRLRARLVSVQADLKRDIARAAKSKGGAKPAADITQVFADEEQRALAEQITAQVAIASYSTGGPAQVFEAAGGALGGGVVIGDYGDELVELIQNTVVPKVWDVNGGPCTIVYYRPLMCLVVRATGDQHRAVDGILNVLRD